MKKAKRVVEGADPYGIGGCISPRGKYLPRSEKFLELQELFFKKVLAGVWGSAPRKRSGCGAEPHESERESVQARLSLPDKHLSGLIKVL